jgi:hypothetical protein
MIFGFIATTSPMETTVVRKSLTSEYIAFVFCVFLNLVISIILTRYLSLDYSSLSSLVVRYFPSSKLGFRRHCYYLLEVHVI